MKIFIITHNLCKGGAERVAANLGNGFVANGHEVYVITDTSLPMAFHLDNRVHIQPLIGEYKNKPQKWLRVIKNVRCYAKRFSPDVIIGFMHVCSAVGRLAVVGLNIPVILTIHNALKSRAYHISWSTKVLDRFMPYFYTHTTILTKADYIILSKYHRNISVMPNPLSYSSQLKIPMKQNQIFAAGRITGWYCKGFDVLIKSWGQVAHKHPQWQLCIAGTGNEQSFNYLKALISQNHVEESVHLLGFRSDMLNLYKESAIFVLSSRSEGLPMVLLEAMSQGCAPVATANLGRTREILPDDSYGLVCEPNDVAALSTAIDYMITHSSYRSAVQAKALLRSRMYSLENVVALWEKIFDNVVR